MNKKIKTIKEAQKSVRDWVKRNGWKDVPNLDTFDHVHEELLELSQYLRYKNEKERIAIVKEKKDIFIEETGDVLWGLCRLANQLGVNLEEAFAITKEKVAKKYKKGKENNVARKREL